MKYITDLNVKIEENTVITLGKFDGLHRGHELLMENLFAIAKERNLKTVVFTFNIPPNKDREKDAQVLTTNSEKKEVFEETGLDYLFECPFTKEVMQMSPERFIEWIVTALGVKAMVVGTDFRFAHKRMGNVETLKQYADVYGYSLLVLDKVTDEGREISSTYVREEIAKGNIKKANALLGYPFFVKNKVVHGKKLGRKIGIPTINMEVPLSKIVPPNGVYVSQVRMEDKLYPSVTNVGCKPTVNEEKTVGIETHIIGYASDLYDRRLKVEFLDFIRSEKRFDSVEQLKQQMSLDIAYVKKQLTVTKMLQRD